MIAADGKYEFVEVTRGDLENVVSSTGTLEAVGTVEVGAVAAEAIFGVDGGRLMSALLSLLLLSTISAMVLAGPRVIEVMAADRRLLGYFGARNRRGDGLPCLTP